MQNSKIKTVCVAYLAIALTGFWLAESTSGFVIIAFGSVCLIDKLTFRVLSWRCQRTWIRECCLHVTWFVLGTASFYYARFGLIPLPEAMFLGLMAALTIGCATSVADLLPNWSLRRQGRGGRLFRLPALFQLACLLFFAVSFPYWHTIHPMHTVPKRGPDAMGFAYEPLSLPTTDGLCLSAWLIPAKDAQASVLFCHGHGRNKGHVAGLLTTLHQSRCNVLAFDFRGHGDSPGHTVNFGGKDIDDLCLAVRYLEARFPNKPVVLVGISYGAAMGLKALGRLPEVKGLWSEGAFGWLTHAVRRRLSCVPAPILKPLVHLYYVLGELDCGLWVPDVNPIDCLDEVHVPILFCHGELDELAPFSDALALYDRYQGPKWNYWITGGSHYNLRQRHRDEYLTRFRKFLSDCIGPDDSEPYRVTAKSH
ncbi:hypothetical protein BH10PLA2_BH10PLA2_03820 [soil metagenome]